MYMRTIQNRLQTATDRSCFENPVSLQRFTINRCHDCKSPLSTNINVCESTSVYM